MNILVLNSGSSSIKCQYFIGRESVASILIERIGEAEGYGELRSRSGKLTHNAPIEDHHQALALLFRMLRDADILSSVEALDAIGHRVVHGGASFDQPTLVTEEVIEAIRELIPLAPLHNPANLYGIEAVRELHPDLPQVAIFDTAFHQTMPPSAYLYPLPYDYYEELGVRRYGFHGTSHAYIAKQAAVMLNETLDRLNLITLHLGNGASATAIRKGESIDTSMGLTPLEGLMMGTRCGDIDPAILPYLTKHLGLDIEAVDTILNKKSGLKGVCGSNDMREVIEEAERGEQRSETALEMYAYRIKKYIGAYSVALGKVDAIVFTGGIGEHAVKIREMVCRGLEDSIGAKLDNDKNARETTTPRSIEESGSRIAILVIPTNEELEIALQTEKIIRGD